MRTLVIALSLFGVSTSAFAASKTLKAAVSRSYGAFKTYEANQKYPNDLSKTRVQDKVHGTTATANIQSYGAQPGPPVVGLQPKTWYTTYTATFKKTGEGWQKTGHWNELFFALSANR